MTRLYVYALLTALVFGSFANEGTEKTFSNTEVMEMMQTLQNEIAGLKEDNAMFRTQTIKLQENNDKLAEEIWTIKAEQEKTKIWTKDMQMDADSLFLATISTGSISISDEEPIVFDTAPINPGGHYNTIVGSYTAPVSGYYQFAVTKRGNNAYGSFYLLVDDARYFFKHTYAYGATNEPSGAATFNIELTAGQIVRVENEGSSLIYGTEAAGIVQSWFTGYLLYAL